MNQEEFITYARHIILNYANKNLNQKLSLSNIFVVWICKVLQNNKALLSTNLLDETYYEITYDGNKEQFYLDVYNKIENQIIPLEFAKEEIG